MDLIYMSETFSHMDVRSQSYSFYDKAWNWDDKENNTTVAEKHRLANLERQKREQQRTSSQHCSLCLQNKRRKLGNYIRQKSVEEGCIEEEEEDIKGHLHTFTESQNRQNKIESAKTKG